MADLKISALTAATTPLAGTEVLPIVQGGVTTKVSVSDLTAGRAVTATSVNKVVITAPTTASTLTIADGKTLAVNDNATLGTGGLTLGNSGGFTAAASKVLTASNTLTLAGTDATTHTFPTTSATIARTDAAQTFTGDQTLSAGNLVIGTDGKGITGTATNGDIPITPNGTGVVVVGSGNAAKQQRIRTQKHTFYTTKNTTSDTVFLEVDFGSTVGAAIVDIVASGTAPAYDSIRYAVRFFCDKNSAGTVTATAITTQGTASMITAAASGTKVQFSIKYFATGTQTNFVGAEVLCVGGQASETTVTASLV